VDLRRDGVPQVLHEAIGGLQVGGEELDRLLPLTMQDGIVVHQEESGNQVGGGNEDPLNRRMGVPIQEGDQRQDEQAGYQGETAGQYDVRSLGLRGGDQ